MQVYSDPKRASEPGALPDVEVFYHDCTDSTEPCPLNDEHLAEYECYGVGWYWQFRGPISISVYADGVLASSFPGSLPDGEPSGPFDTEQDAIRDAQEGVGS